MDIFRLGMGAYAIRRSNDPPFVNGGGFAYRNIIPKIAINGSNL